MRLPTRTCQVLALLSVSVGTIPLLVAEGCTSAVPGPAPPVAAVTSPSLDQTMEVGQLITMVYDAIDPAGGIVLASAFIDRDRDENNGFEMVLGAEAFGQPLPGGLDRFAQIPTDELDPGVWYVGVIASNSAGTTTVYAGGSVTLIGAPALTFTSPAADLMVGTGVPIPVIFDAGTGVTSFTYRIFYDTDATFDGDEFNIAQGSSTDSSQVEEEFDTTGLVANSYFVGARITTSDGRIATAYAPGAVTIVTGPFAAILSPQGGVTAAAGTPVLIRVAAGNPGVANPMVTIFYDLDKIPGNGNETPIATVPIVGPVTEITWQTGGVPTGSYYIGAELVGASSGQVGYSAGTIQILGTGAGAAGPAGTAFLTMRSPLREELLVQGQEFTIRWATSLTIGEGTIEVFREPDVDGDGMPDGPSTRVAISTPGLDASTRSLVFETTGVVGKYFIGGTINPVGGTAETDYAEGSLTIVPLMFWVGNLETLAATEEPSPQRTYLHGAVFRGHNVGDNLGNAVLVADDYDDDGNDEVVLAAQFGKPFLLQQGGRGAGEAYMIYGQQGRRYLGNYEVNMTGSDDLPGLIFAGIVPNPNEPSHPRGNPLGYQVDGGPPAPFSTEGLGSLTLIPDQDNDGKMDLVFGFPWCDSYSLANQVADGRHPAPLPGLGRLENNGHFLRGGAVIVASTNELLSDPGELSRHFDRVMMLHEVGQVFTSMRAFDTPGDDFDVPAVHDFLPRCCDIDPPLSDDDIGDIAFFPGEGFVQDTLTPNVFPVAGTYAFGIDPLRLATPEPASRWGPPEEAVQIAFGEMIDLSQVDPPPGPTSDLFVGGRLYGRCVSAFTDADGNPTRPFGYFPPAGSMIVLGTGFYYDRLPNLGDPTCGPLFIEPYDDYCPSIRIADARPPFGCRVLGQTTTQLFTNPPTTANRFAYSVSVSGDFLLIGAPRRTVIKGDVTALRNDPLLGDRVESGEIYMLPLKRPGAPAWKYMWNSQGNMGTDDDGNPVVVTESTVPAPHNYIIQDLGYSRCLGNQLTVQFLNPGDVAFEMTRPFHIVGQAGDRIGDVTGLFDINNDGVNDFAVGGAGTNGGRGAVYVLYRRQPEIEGDYLLERLQLDPADLNRLNGLMILGRQGENLGTAVAGGGLRLSELNDDYNGDGFADLLIGSPNAAAGGSFQAGEVFILFGGRNLLSPQGGVTIPELRDAGDGMVIAGVNARDRTGATVANAGDVNRDGVADILIAAPDASPRFDSTGDGVLDSIGVDLNADRVADDLDGDGVPDDMTGAGIVYLVFGGEHLTGTIGLEQIGTKNLPGMMFVGQKAGDHLGGGTTQGGLLSRGVHTAGDLDGDNYGDFFISAVLADPEGKTDAGEVYLVYGFAPPSQSR